MLLTVGWGVNQWLIRPRLKRDFRETILKQKLHDMRKVIDQFANDRGNLPQSLDDLVKQGYIREIPIDPITKRKDWDVEFAAATADFAGGQGIVDVHSAALEISSNGVPYSDF